MFNVLEVTTIVELNDKMKSVFIAEISHCFDPPPFDIESFFFFLFNLILSTQQK